MAEEEAKQLAEKLSQGEDAKASDKKSVKPKKQKKEDLNYIYFFKRPYEVDTIPAGVYT